MIRKTLKLLPITIFTFMGFSVLCGNVFAGQVPDTGQTKCYNNSVEITCPSPGENFYGQDAQYEGPARSYTKMNASFDLADGAISWTMVRDNVTGLIWEVKTDDNSIHDKDNFYDWQNAQSVFISALNNANFGDQSDWRMPTIKELSTLVNSDIPYPGSTIDTAWFPHTMSSCYWSATTYADNTSLAWHVGFYDGNVSGNPKSLSYYVRAVRAGQTGALDHLINNDDGTVTDKNTGLMWQKNTVISTTWESALGYCEDMSLAGYDDWRLPNRNELQSIVDYAESYLAIDSVFTDTVSSLCWSATTFVRYTNTAWLVNFYSGGVTNGGKSSSYYVRAVRAGQSGSLDHLVILAPLQGSFWDVGDVMPITWGTDGLGDNVKISISRQAGKDDTFETIISSTSNDGAYNWIVSGADSVNCTIKIEQADNAANWATQGLFSINDGQPPTTTTTSTTTTTTSTTTTNMSTTSTSTTTTTTTSTSTTTTSTSSTSTTTTSTLPPQYILNGHPVPDTGQTKCYNNTEEIPCPNSGQSFFGQDACYSAQGPSFTKLDEYGNELADTATSWTLVRDNVTGLVWEVKGSSDGMSDYLDPNDSDNQYCWFDPEPSTNGGDPGLSNDGTDTLDFIDLLNENTYGSYSDWRMPNVKELILLINYDEVSPAVFSVYFPNFKANYHWTSTTYAGGNSKAWFVDFNGRGLNVSSKFNYYHVRAVRGIPIPVGAYLNNDDGTITDNHTGLMWQQIPLDADMNWQSSLIYCESLSLAGYDDWRLPSVNELLSIIDHSQHDPAMDTSIFQGNFSIHWTSTTDVKGKNYTREINLNSGTVGNWAKVADARVRAVRSLPENHRPYAPHAPMPYSGASGISTSASLSWQGGDEDVDDTVVYDVYFGPSLPLQIRSTSQGDTSYQTENLQYGSTYYWKIVARDTMGWETESPLWHFISNVPPNAAANPLPNHGATNVPKEIILSWTGSDPDPSQALAYDVYLGTDVDPDLVEQGLTKNSYTPVALDYNTEYFWKVVTWDSQGASTEGTLWSFTTKSAGTVIGNLTTMITGSDSPISGAMITVEETGAFVISDEQGGFVIDGLFIEECTLLIEKEHFEPMAISNIQVVSGNVVDIGISTMSAEVCKSWDVNNDGLKGLEEAIDALQTVAGLRDE